MSFAMNYNKTSICSVISLICALIRFWPLAHASSEVRPEYQVKALYLYNFLLFVDWPEKAFDTSGTFTIGILGKDPFGEAFDPIKGKKIKGRKVMIKQFDRVQDLSFCHLLFISSSERSRMPRIIEKIKGWSVLTVSDMEGFVHLGGMIGFSNILAQDNLRNARGPMKKQRRFEINLTAANQTGLKIRSRLLRLADIVQSNTK